MKDSLAFVFWLAVVVAAYFFMPRAPEVLVEEQEETTIVRQVDMSEEAKNQMNTIMMEYNKCMMQNRPEYHKQGVSAANVAEKTLFACDPHLDDLAVLLEENNVNEGLRVGMAKTVRIRAARKLMSMVMQSMAVQSMAVENAKEAEAVPAQ